MLASIIGVGTELTTGQIIDKNSSWISKKLKDVGLQTSLHMVVPDDRQKILQALDFCASLGDTLFVTGGLGPTSDDFTRDLIAEWAKAPLVFDEASWKHVCDRLSSRNIVIRDIQKQQCFFPQGAEVLTNPEGTANGFYLRANGKDVFVLPGPPAEIAAIWQGSIQSRMVERAKSVDRIVTYSWDTLGYGESDIANLTETALKDIIIEKGYRVHLPYVEVKVSFRESQQKAMAAAVQKLDDVLKPMTVAKNGVQLSERLVELCAGVESVELIDAVSGKYLLGRISTLPAFAKLNQAPSWSFSTALRMNPKLPSEQSGASGAHSHRVLKLILKPLGTVDAEAEIHFRGGVFRDHFQAPAMIVKNPHRRGMYFAECALVFWVRSLEAMV